MSRFARVLQPLAFGLAVAVSDIASTAVPASAADPLHESIDRHVKAVESKLIAWRRDIHQNPELGNREVRTSGLVAAHLRKLG